MGRHTSGSHRPVDWSSPSWSHTLGGSLEGDQYRSPHRNRPGPHQLGDTANKVHREMGDKDQQAQHHEREVQLGKVTLVKKTLFPA